MKLNTSFLLLFLTLFLSSCVDFKGTFTADEEMTLKHSTMFGNTRERVIPAGRYETSFRFLTVSNKVKLVLRGADNITVKIDFPRHGRIPRNGEFYIPAESSGQNYDIEGLISRSYDDSPIYHGVERCDYVTYEQRCSWHCYGPNGTHCEWICRDERVVRRGRQNVSYYYQSLHSAITLDLIEPVSKDPIGRFEGYDSDSTKVYTYRGPCRPY